MKKYLLLISIFTVTLAACKKSNLTPDGKPKADAGNNTLRVFFNSTAAYSFTTYLSTSDFSSTTKVEKEGLTASYEYVATAQSGQRLMLVMSSDAGSALTCDVYYKGNKVQLSALTLDKTDGLPGIASNLQIDYRVGN